MRQWSLIFVLVMTGCASVQRPAAPLRLLVYNIHAGRDASGADNLERVAALIRSVDPDLVLLQEVDRNTTRSGGVDQLSVLMRLTNRYGVMGKSLDYQGGDYGIATLSRWPVERHQTVKLRVEPAQVRAGGSLEPRVALIVETRSPGGMVRVVNTHLDASREDRYRLQEVETLLAAIVRSDGPVLAGGDFNSTPESAVHQRVDRAGLRDAWLECGGATGFTYPADVPSKRIDYLFVRAWRRCTSAEVIDTTASDHRPLLVTFMPGATAR